MAAIPLELPRHAISNGNKGVNMYATKAVNGAPAIQRDGQSVLSVCNQNWEFANWLCDLLNELGNKSELLLNEQDWEWLGAIDRAFRRTAQHA
jgi:hypothetical protein